MAILAARISYFLNCKGPCLTIDTACSSSLVAIHLACESIHKDESQVALAGGVFVLSSPEYYVMASKAQMLSPDGKCKTFDKSANGSVLGEGVGAVILKSLEAALEDGDHIYGVIKGSGVNQDGRTRGITAPSMLSQKALLSDLYKNASVHPETISYIEVHGIGTKLGDPIEVKALTETFRLFTDKSQFCAIGTQKPNVGHTVISAGMAGIFKVLMAMKYQQIPPTINLKEVSQHIDVQGGPFFINTELREWTSPDGSPRRAGVSSFGMSGTNCHVILEEPPLNERMACRQAKSAYFFPFSAKTKAALSQKVIDMLTWLEKEGEYYSVEDLSYTLVLGRSHFSVRSAVVVRDTNELKHALREIISKGQSQHEEINQRGKSSEQTEPGLHAYGNWLLQELREDASFAQKEYQEKLVVLADLYVKGCNLDWSQLFKKGRYHRVPLPTYPFSGESYWIGENTDPYQDIVREAVSMGNGGGYESTPRRELIDDETRQGMQEMEELLYQFLWSCLQSLGLFRERHALLANLREQAGIIAIYDRWLQESIALLERRQYLYCERASVTDGHVTCTVTDSSTLIESTTLWQHWDQHREHWMQKADLKAQVVLAETMLHALPAILTGKRPATEVLFPQASMQLVKGIYQYNRVSDYFNEVLARFLATYLQERLTYEGHARIRILEIGAGTGATTNQVLQMLQPYQTSIAEYCYSDISAAFLRYGQQMYGAGAPYLTYQIFDVAKPLAGQGIELGSYDVVIATNVLHATSNIRRAVRNAKAALKKHGLLLLNEITGKSLFFHMTFALLKGWWAYEDAELRVPGSPALSAESWEAALSSEGFGAIYHPTQGVASGLPPQVVGQQIIVAVADVPCATGGAVRQPVAQANSPQAFWSGYSPESQGTVSTDKLHEALKHMVSHLLNVRVEEIDVDAELPEYGFDSITFMEFANCINQTYRLDLTPPLFYEYSTIERLSQYMQKTYTAILVHDKNLITNTVLPIEANTAQLRTESAGTGSEPHTTIGASPMATVPVREMVAQADQTGYNVPSTQAGRFGERLIPCGRPVPPLIEGSTVASRIAIIGMSGIFPQAPDVQSLWSNLLEGKNCIGEIPASRWDWHTYFGSPATSHPNKTSIKWAGVIEGVETFDPLFFGISKAEAEQMDPQQRLLMIYVWKAIEDAGYAASSLSGTNTALFVGTASSGYSERLSRAAVPIEGYASTSQLTSVGPNRMSYFLNLHGPSEPVETACSSSLIAIHRGVNAIESGQCTMAIVGGVNTIISPEQHISFSKAGMLSEDGHCKPFSAQANGFVRGEGVGLLVLKKLSDAEQAGDHIYGVIRGSAENHGGHASSFTAPNPRAQADLLVAAYRKAGIDPRTVGYIETHGTGTALGDPIEINGLKTAFKELVGVDSCDEEPTPQAWCGIGSVKSNIGHLELAAGVVGVIKVLLQLQHKKLVKSLHGEQINPYIQLEGSPFYIVQDNREWEAIPDHTGNVLPRRAGVSAFGFGGVNAHMVLEEYVPSIQATEGGQGTSGEAVGTVPMCPVLIVLSAKNEERLYEQVKQLLSYIQNRSLWADPTGTKSPQMLWDLAYTLQVGREAMEERLALQVSSLAELEENLHNYLQKPQETGKWYRGQVKRYKEMVALLSADEELQEAIDKWLRRGKYEKLLEWWVKGLNISWSGLYGEQRPRRISLPTYPFARERYWIPAATSELTTGSIGTTVSLWNKTTSYAALHPLVQRNTSTLWEQQYSSTFHGGEFFLVDHEVFGQRVMPGVAYLEMARAAVREAIGTAASLQASSSLHLNHIVWAHPLVVGQSPVTVRIALEPQDDATIAFAISREGGQESRGGRVGWSHPASTSPTEEETTAQSYCQGRVVLRAKSDFPNVDLTAVQARCQHQLSATECYQHYRELGLNYGPAFQGIEQLNVGEGEVLAQLRLPVAPEVVQTHTEGGCREADGGQPHPYVLHPSMLDSALQACIGLGLTPRERHELQVVFALEGLSIVGEVPAQGWAWVRRSPHNATGIRADIDLCDDTGRVTVCLRGLSTRPLPRPLPNKEETRTVLLVPDWQEEAIPHHGQTLPLAPSLVLLCELAGIKASHLQTQMAPGETYRSLGSLQPNRELRFQDIVLQLIQELQDLLRSRSAGPVLVQVVVVHKEEPSFLQALAGLLKTAQQEYPQLRGQLIEIEGEPEEGQLLIWLRENQKWPQVPHIRYRDGKRWVREWQEYPQVSVPPRIPWKEGGYYLITGGAGGLARLFVQEIAQQVQQATIILAGRSPLSASSRAQLDALASASGSSSGIHIDYQQVDVTDGPAVHALIQRILARSGHLDGIIHAAGLLRDRLLLNKMPEEVRAVLAPKVIGVEQLDQASKQIPLDFFILCSSISAVMGNVGQADYAVANAYLDAFAHARAAKVLAGERQGATVSINWPLWDAGGMQVDALTRKMIQERLDIERMDTETGMRMLYQALSCKQAQVMVAHGRIERIKQRLLQTPDPSANAVSELDRISRSAIEEEQQEATIREQDQSGESTGYGERAAAYFKKQLAALIKLPVQQIETDAPLQDYGFDSIMAIRFTNALENSFGPLSKTLLFEHATLYSLTQYFLHSYPKQLTSLLVNSKYGSGHIGAGTEPVGTGSAADRASPSPASGLAPLAFGTIPTAPDYRRDKHPPHRLTLSSSNTMPDKEARGSDIAIIGVAGRYPGARDLHTFWENLRQGRDCVTEIPPERWDYRLYFDADKNKPGTTYSKWGGFLEGVDEFDPLFFNISPRDAERMDPQERLFLECVFATLEDAGYTRESLSRYQGDGLAGNVGIFVGVMYEEYQLFGAEAQMQGCSVALSGSPSSIANRVSYFCNFHGPSMAVDTMCSSSLTAIHLACQSIRTGGCELAIAGGVNVSVHPNKYLWLSQGKFVSSQGHCQSFGVGADGYVPSEGVGAVLLKPLAQAEADGDHIHGVIKATAINHGGKTNGYTVPNPQAQTEVIGRALKEAGIDPRTISYIEAHGTGTVLGDPIEIAGLARAFESSGVVGESYETTDKRSTGWCAIGSVKSNIGHAESAAGIAGITKVLLQMRYGQLVPSLHAEMLNPHIDFSATPFVVQQELSEWKRPQVLGKENGKEADGAYPRSLPYGPLPRRAGVSSFGAGGSNAHAILEEYVERQRAGEELKSVGTGSELRTIPTIPVQRSRPALIVLSARTQEQLYERVQQLLSWIQERSLYPHACGAEEGLDNLAYTLQVGREPMEERLALLVDSLQELEEKLGRYSGEGQKGGDWYRGQVKRYNPIGAFAADEDGQQTVAAWMSKGKYEKLLEWWVNGLTVDWKRLYTVGAGSEPRTGSAQGTIPTASALPRRISLPTYPFARERYWIPTSAIGTCRVCGQGQSSAPTSLPTGHTTLHPLVQYNISDFFEQRFSSTFQDDEFFLADHQVLGQCVMPGVAYLEMARAAIDQAMRSSMQKDGRILRLSQVAWIRPLVISKQPVEVHIALELREERKVVFTISSQTHKREDEALDIVSQGRAELHMGEEIAQSLDLTTIQTRCQHFSLSATECYQRYRSLGISYGPAMQGIEQLSVGEGEVLARLRLPAVVAQTPQGQPAGYGFVLHPSMLDAALQACIGLLIEQQERKHPYLPFALEELLILDEVPAQGWAWVRQRIGIMPHADPRRGSDPVPTSVFDIEVCDDAGRIVLRLHGLSTRMLLSADALANGQDTSALSAPLAGSLEGGDRDEIGARHDPYSPRPLLYAPLWDLVLLPQPVVAPRDSTSQVVIVGGTPDEQSTIAHLYPHAHTLELPTSASIEQMAQGLQEFGSIEHLFWLAPCDPHLSLTQESILAAQQQGVLACFRLIKALLQLGYASQTLRWIVITRQTRVLHTAEIGDPTHAGLLGLFGSLAKEYAHWNIQHVDLPVGVPLPLIEMLRLPADPQGHGWLYRYGHWYRQTLVPLDVSSFKTREVYRRGGVYVVIGGAGGIGEVWSEYLIRKYQAQIVWVGRRPIDAGIEAKLQRLAVPGPRPHYITADATDWNALQQAYQETKQKFGQINGIVHSAIVLLDRSLANMEEKHFQAALAAKVEVSVRLAQVFEREPLDFVLFFSSLNAFTRNAGQSNYAAGSTFEDAFAARLSRDWPCAVKVMNWGYWGSVGVVASQEYRERMAQAGLGSIEPAEAMEALEELLAGPADQMALLKTTKPVAPGFALWGEIIRAEEMMTVYPEHIPSYIHSLRSCPTDENTSPNQNVQRELTEAETRQGMQEMEKLLCELLWGQLQSLGIFREKHAVLTRLREQAGISTNYDRWLQESIRLLERQRYLHCHDATCTIADPTLIEQAPLWRCWDEHKERWMQNIDLKAQVVLVETMLRVLPAVLTGKRSATEVLFPHGSIELVEEIYQHNTIADTLNEILATQVTTYLRERLTGDRHARIRILEVGAGTGGTTRRILQKLRPYQEAVAEYCYSDVSEVFLSYGQRKYGADNSFLTYQHLNVEKPLAEQGVKLGSYDLVIATNVLHATSNIRHTVRNAKAALKKHGLLLLNEITGASLFSHLTFGLLSGWWAYEDPELRVQGCPALTAENWQAVLSSEGFGEIYVPTQNMPTGRLAPQEAGQQVIVAESDGVVRQPRSLPPRVAPSQLVIIDQDKPTANANLDEATTSDEILRERSITYLKEQAGKVLNLPSEKIDAAEPLINYGLDSVLVLQLTNTLRTDMEQITSTLFFEYATVDALVEHFLCTQREALERLVGLSVSANSDHSRVPRRFLMEEHIGDKRGAEGNTVGTESAQGTIPTASVCSGGQAQGKGASPLPTPTARFRDIAIIGLTGRYPQAKDIQAFWHLLKAGKSGIREIPASRWDWRPYFQTDKGAAGSIYTKWGGFLEDIEYFDAAFFHISPREAEQMDPQERLFLEASYACIQDAGYTPGGLREQGSVGVFVGVMHGNYPTGARYWSIANRVSFVLGLQGPSAAIDTACSSSLTALHFAVESLLSGTSASALVGGVNLIVDPVHYMRLSQQGMLSASDQCKSFGENADGFVDGEGVGAILLKPLDRAEADGDHIYGVIKATAINHGGKTNGYMVPNPQGQAEVIEQALQRASIDPRTISYVEAHGTGTVLGDPIEIAGLTRAFGKGTQDKQYCAIGSVKSNIGHMESAAGIAGVTKVLLQMHYKQLVPSLHAEGLNPHIDFSATPFVVQQELSEWRQPQVPEASEDNGRDAGEGQARPRPRRAGVSSFGAGGSNAHVILEEYIEQRGRSHRAGPDGAAHPALIVLSARNQEQLNEQVRQLLSWLQEVIHADETSGGEPCLDDLAYTLQVGREAMEERLAMQVRSLPELEEKLHRYIGDAAHEGDDWYRGQVKRHDAINIFATDEDGQKTVATWMSKGKYEKLLEFWVRGGTIDWKDLYAVGVEQAQAGSGLRTAAACLYPQSLRVPALPRRISLPTYPFARQRYWFPTNGTSPLSIVQPEAVASPSVTMTADNTHENGRVSNKLDRVTLRPLGDGPERLHGESEQGLVGSGLAPESAPTSPSVSANGADHTQPSFALSRPDQSLPQSSSNDIVIPVRTPMVQRTQPTILELEKELTRSLAQALYMESSAIDVEIPFVEMGLDSVIGVEWIQSLNKQYTSNLAANCVYDYPTIRQLASFLKKDLFASQQETIQPALTLSLDDLLQQVQQGSLKAKEANLLLKSALSLDS